MRYVNIVRIVVQKHLADIEKIDEKIEKLNSCENDHTTEYFGKQMELLQRERAEAIEAGKRNIDGVLSQYKYKISQLYTPNGEQITPDAALLTSGMKLSQTELERIFDKNAGNMTMQRLVSEFAEQNNINFNRTYFPEDYIIDSATAFADTAKRALTDKAVYDALYDSVPVEIEID